MFLNWELFYRILDLFRGERIELVPTDKNFVWRFLGVVQRQTGFGEGGGNNAGPLVARYKHIPWTPKLDGKNLGPWCASGTSWCLEEAAGGPEAMAKRLGVSLKEWNRRRHAAKGLFRMLRDRYGAIGPDEAPEPGMLALWERGKAGDWRGHISPVTSSSRAGFYVTHFNRGGYPAKVQEFYHVINEPGLLGFCYIA